MRKTLAVALLLINLETVSAQIPSEPVALLRVSAGYDALATKNESIAASLTYTRFASPLPLGVRFSAVLRSHGREWKNENSYEVAGLTGFSLYSESMLFSVLSGISTIYNRYNGRSIHNGAQFGGEHDDAVIDVYSLGLPFDISFLFQPKAIGIGLSVVGNLNAHRSMINPSLNLGIVW
jgi:hypothetical protein